MSRRSKIKKKLSAFTLAEILVTLALTSIAVTFLFSTLSYVQKLFQAYRQQNTFINQYVDLKQRLEYEMLHCKAIVAANENNFIFKRDCTETALSLYEKKIIMCKGTHCDTFNFGARNIKSGFETMHNTAWAGKLVNSIVFETEFTKQRFNFYFYKNYDASVKLELEANE